MDSAETKKRRISAEEKEQLQQRLVLLKKQYMKVQQKLQRVEKIQKVRSHVRRTIAEQNQLLLEGDFEDHGLEDGDGHIYNQNKTPKVGIQKDYQEKATTVTFQSQPKVIELYNIPESGAKKVSEPLTDSRLDHSLSDTNTDSCSQSQAVTGSELGNVTHCDRQTHVDEKNMKTSKAVTEQRITSGACRSDAEFGCEQRSQTQGYKQGALDSPERKQDSPCWEISNRVLESGNIHLQKYISVIPTMSDSPCAVVSSVHNTASDCNFSTSKMKCSRSSLQSQRDEVNCIPRLTSYKHNYANSDDELSRQNETSSLPLKCNGSASDPVQEYSTSNTTSPKPSNWPKIHGSTKLDQYSGNMKDVYDVQEVIGTENESCVSQERLSVDNKPTEKINNDAGFKHMEAKALENSETPELDINEEDYNAQGTTCTQSELMTSGNEKHAAMEHKIQCSETQGSSVKKKQHSLPQTQQSETCGEANPEHQKCATEAHRTEPATSHTLVTGLPFPVEYYVRTTRSMANRHSQVDLHTVINNVLKTRCYEGDERASRVKLSRRKKIAPGTSEENTIPETEQLFASSNLSESSEKSTASLPLSSESHHQLVEVSGLKSVLLNDTALQTLVYTPVAAREYLTDTEVDCNTGILKRHVLSISRRRKVKGKKNRCRLSWQYNYIEPSGIQSLPLSLSKEEVGLSVYENTTVPLKIQDMRKDILKLGCHNEKGINIDKEFSNIGPPTARDSESQSEDLILDTQCSKWSHGSCGRSSSLSIGSETEKQGSPVATAQGQGKHGPAEFECPDVSTCSQELAFSLGLVLSCLQTMCQRRVVREFSLPDNEFAQLKQFHAQREVCTPNLIGPRRSADEGEVNVNIALGVPCEEKCSVTYEDGSLADQEGRILAKVDTSSPADRVTDEMYMLAHGDSREPLSTTLILSTPLESGQVQRDQMSALHLSPLQPAVGLSPVSLCQSQACVSSQMSGSVRQPCTNHEHDDVNGHFGHNPQVSGVKDFTYSVVNDASPCKGELPPAVIAAAPGCHERWPAVRSGVELSSPSSGADLQDKEHQDFVRTEPVHPSQPDNSAAMVQMSSHGLNFAVPVSDGDNGLIGTTQRESKQEFHWQLEFMATIQCSGNGGVEALCSGFWELQGHPCRCLIVAQKSLVSLWAEHWEDRQWHEIHTWVLGDETEVSELLPIQDSLSPQLVALAGSVRLLHVARGSADVIQPLIGETVVAAVALRQQRVVWATRGRLGQTLTLLSLDEQQGSHCASHLSTPDDDIVTLSNVPGEDEALIGSTELKDLIIWNVKSGNIICRIALTSLGTCSLCRRVVSDSGLLFAMLSPKTEISEEEDGADPSAFENMACTLAAINPSSKQARTVAHYKLPSGHTGGFVCGVLSGGTLAAAFTSGSMALWDTFSGELCAVWPPSSSGQRWVPLDWAMVSHNHMALLGNVEGSVKVFQCGPR